MVPMQMTSDQNDSLTGGHLFLTLPLDMDGGLLNHLVLSTLTYKQLFRACPGRHFSETSSFIVIACILHLYHILPVEAENGPELPKEDDLDSGVILYVTCSTLILTADYENCRRPKPFKCRIIPRSPAAMRLLEEL